ncbi:ketoacyl-ACP synthase III [Myroides sp. 1354]|uniref:3-oxoacyl-[acyl-carrier-protein] synthase III C-terminal domain-containing protein n=1 Tax=unclassified Myroides TaxID=2642485 RepID=UPI002577686F|nr:MULTISPECIES: 3-oxoacyl-[acyl-carrier-protein] synthase III C-terminal domain-containing protein [unclassified Myroides]MDM1046335.1 ketoacyl-ACP synthase III [Myroides sp. R163-1]MDM1057272.1 ketoacyl-ACP synthase III [Myroides sp. 1354]MDM1070493.1 ketoacyl-ACP synthase III [Myroides sp. 1372]
MKLKHLYFHHPSNLETNESVIQEFEAKEIPMQKLQEALGRTHRYIIPSQARETSLSLGIEAAKGVLCQSNISIEDIDLIIFVSSTPEHQVPCDAIFIHRALQGKPNTMCYDLNANCIGAFIAVDQSVRYLATNSNTQKALIVCAEKLSRIVDDNNPVTAFCFSDTAFALILEKDDTTSGLLAVEYHTDSQCSDTILFPPQGYSCSIPGDVMAWDTTFDGSGSIHFVTHKLEHFLAQHQLTLDDISLFLFSQFSYKNAKMIKDYYQLADEKTPFYSHVFGYTGSSSPFLVLHHFQETVRPIKQGEYILIWTLGAGYQTGLMLWKY